MSSKKSIGSFYTPTAIADFIVKYISPTLSLSTDLNILEPSAGNGEFVRAIYKHNHITEKIASFVAVEREKDEVEKIKNLKTNQLLTCICSDFLEFQQKNLEKFDVVIGNPPYIKKSHLTKKQIELCGQIHASCSLSTKTIKNIWTAFLLRSVQYLTEEGILAFVLPSDLLQVAFSKELRNFLTTNFQRTEIFTFGDLLFECKGQDTVLLFGFKRSNNPGQFFTHIKDIQQLELGRFRLKQNIALENTNIKWTHHMLPSEDLNFLLKIKKSLKTVNDYCDSKPGIVTAANNFFIVNELTEKAYGLQQYTYPIIQKCFFVNGSVVFNQKDFKELVVQGKPTKILCFHNSDAGNISEVANLYLEMGKDIGLSTRYKCDLRDNWFVIPNISTVPEGFFFRRSHHYPKLLKNEAKVLVTDSAYKIQAQKGFHINDIVYSFYNSLTLTFAELDGRYYGGGVLELTPQEFKNLPLPNVHINNKEFKEFTSRFERKADIAEVLESNDPDILNANLGLSTDDVRRIEKIYRKLIHKRFRQ